MEGEEKKTFHTQVDNERYPATGWQVVKLAKHLNTAPPPCEFQQKLLIAKGGFHWKMNRTY